MTLRGAWDKLGEYIAVYVAVITTSLVLRFMIRKWKARHDGPSKP